MLPPAPSLCSWGSLTTAWVCRDGAELPRPSPQFNPMENSLADTRGVAACPVCAGASLHFPDAAGFLHPVYFRGMIVWFLDTQPACSQRSPPAPCGKEAPSALKQLRKGVRMFPQPRRVVGRVVGAAAQLGRPGGKNLLE